jgi:hypothetical protein
MLLTKDAAFVDLGEGKFQYVPWDRPNFGFPSGFATTKKVKSNLKGKATFEGTKPDSELRYDPKADMATLAQDALNYCADKYGNTDTFKALPKDTVGMFALLHFAGLGIALDLNAEAQTGVRVATVDPAVLEAQAIKQIIDNAKKRGKILTNDQALKIRAAQLAAEAEFGL